MGCPGHLLAQFVALVALVSFSGRLPVNLLAFNAFAFFLTKSRRGKFNRDFALLIEGLV